MTHPSQRTASTGVMIAAAGALFAATPACNEGSDSPSPESVASAVAAASSAEPLDRLAPGELQPGTEEAFGLVIPRRMKITRRFKTSAHAVGRVKPEDVANFVRERVEVGSVELGAARSIFPKAIVKLGDPTRHLRIEVLALQRDYTQLEIHDITPRPSNSTKTKGLTDADRWRQAGFNPDGTPLNPKQLQ